MMKILVDGEYEHAVIHPVLMQFARGMNDIGKVRGRKIVQMIGLPARVLAAKRKFSADCLYYGPCGPNWPPAIRDIFLLALLRPFFRRTILHFHAAGLSELYSRCPAILRPFFRRAFFDADVAISLSEFNPPDHEVFRAKRVHYVPNGIPDVYSESGSELAGVRRSSGRAVEILFVGVLMESKGILILVEAIGLLPPAVRQGLKVVVLGQFSSPRFEQVVRDRLAACKVETQFDFRGVTVGVEKHRAFLSADIFCLPTFFEAESFSLVVAEAMQFRLPVVATRWRGVQSLVEDGTSGYLVPPKEPGELADRLLKLIEDPGLRSRMGDAGRAKFLKEYTVTKFRQRMDRVFKEVQ
ncbi:glycosyltransferase family 4 protein [Ramlibacter sp.]|uniref:glycosyltransferase family 4 protein n=1 Tax=Ramlibacter sp. TaxID=1917967 RepID=UPI00260B4EA3|nr:glycosyltransferase family 4 protein [Ramlibacter sp.]MDB5957084.1 mshA 4 [Ramlibacter sp.]